MSQRVYTLHVDWVGLLSLFVVVVLLVLLSWLAVKLLAKLRLGRSESKSAQSGKCVKLLH